VIGARRVGETLSGTSQVSLGFPDNPYETLLARGISDFSDYCWSHGLQVRFDLVRNWARVSTANLRS
jgi:hypothetical protein